MNTTFDVHIVFVENGRRDTQRLDGVLSVNEEGSYTVFKRELQWVWFRTKVIVSLDILIENKQ